MQDWSPIAYLVMLTAWSARQARRFDPIGYLAERENASNGKNEGPDNNGRQLAFSGLARDAHPKLPARQRIKPRCQVDAGNSEQNQHQNDGKVNPELTGSDDLAQGNKLSL